MSRAGVTRLAVAAAALSVAVVSAAAVGAETAGRAADARAGAPAFLAGIVRLLAANRYEAAWEGLHPEDQQLVARDLYARCESRDPIPGRLARLRVVSVTDDRVIVVPGRPAVASVSVVFDARIVGRGPGEDTHVVITAHAVAVLGHWRWMLPPTRIHRYYEPPCSPEPPQT